VRRSAEYKPLSTYADEARVLVRIVTSSSAGLFVLLHSPGDGGPEA
jgi:hypothetical protein